MPSFMPMRRLSGYRLTFRHAISPSESQTMGKALQPPTPILKITMAFWACRSVLPISTVNWQSIALRAKELRFASFPPAQEHRRLPQQPVVKVQIRLHNIFRVSQEFFGSFVYGDGQA